MEDLSEWLAYIKICRQQEEASRRGGTVARAIPSRPISNPPGRIGPRPLGTKPRRD